MLGRRGAARRNRQNRDRHHFFSYAAHQPNFRTQTPAPPNPPTQTPKAQIITHAYKARQIHHHQRNKQQPPDQHTTTTAIIFTWPDPDNLCPHAVLVASFDNFLHHHMQPSTPDHHTLTLSVKLPVPFGRHTYKFLVNGRWTTHPALHAVHPIEMSEDGVKHHVIIIDHTSAGRKPTPLAQITPNPNPPHKPDVREAHLTGTNAFHPAATDTQGTVFRSASASAAPSVNPKPPPSTTAPRPSLPQANKQFGTNKTVAASLPDTTRPAGSRLVTPRGSSFNTTPRVSGTPSNLSNHAPGRMGENRKSILHRVGSGWRRRFSNRPDAAQMHADPTTQPAHHPAVSSPPSQSLSRSNFPNPDRSASAIFRTSKDNVHNGRKGSTATGDRQDVALLQSSSEPTVSRSRDYSEDKENLTCGGGMSAVRSSSAGGAMADRRRMPLRGSSRNTAVKVSGPTRVDEPRDVEEVNRQADNWRQMARHLQESLHDAPAARELLEKAIAHREKHGLECSTANAQVHTDLARNLSKADCIAEAEMHLRTGLGIYNRLGMGSEHIADLQLYVGVMVDRQKRREEAEELYKQALEMYKHNGVNGNNMNIAIKNLVLNLRKQSRSHEIPLVYSTYGRCEED